ncbi:hypothetical protein PENTCL1PPCAC_28275 [Pristionchus entomophagus]|uniref:Uncharacterized protein n=1 Tax=Pristionchus entomophagus TaxID=358040 RepID=A0AAV5UGD6_9BILA|nr:hypothetical protein PENTCL1PPCAC_28275 [Pristionchus entomophagus]
MQRNTKNHSSPVKIDITLDDHIILLFGHRSFQHISRGSITMKLFTEREHRNTNENKVGGVFGISHIFIMVYYQ